MREGFTAQRRGDQDTGLITFKQCLVGLVDDITMLLRLVKFLLTKLVAKPDETACHITHVVLKMSLVFGVFGGIETGSDCPGAHRRRQASMILDNPGTGIGKFVDYGSKCLSYIIIDRRVVEIF